MNSIIIIAIIAIVIIGAAGFMFMRGGTDTFPTTDSSGIDLDESAATLASEQASSTAGDLADEFSSADNLDLLEP